jgi:hypothetical protein
MARALKTKTNVIPDSSNSLKSIESFKKATLPMRVVNSFKRLINQLNTL